jgi:hypothetical protein
MSYTSGVNKSYGLYASENDVPLILKSSQKPRPVPSDIHTNAIQSSSSQDQGPNGQIFFQIPTGQSTGYLKPCSTYLKCRITPTYTTDWCFNNPTHDASASIRRLTVSVGSQVVEQIDNYSLYSSILLAHTTNRNYLESDANIMSGASIAKPALTSTFVDVVIPIASGLFCGERAIPLFLMNAPLGVTFDLETLYNAVISTGGTVTNFAISKTQLVYETVNVDDMMKMSIRQSLAEGRLFQININTVMGLKYAYGNTTSQTYSISPNVSSLKALMYALSVDPTTTTANRYLLSRTIGDNSDFNVLVDGKKIVNMPINSNSVAFAEFQKALGLLNDVTMSFAGASATGALANYTGQLFASAVSTNRFNESMAYTGIPCQNVTATVQVDSGATASDVVYFFVVYDQVLTIDANGATNLIR